MKKVLAFDVDQTLNVAKTPVPEEIADLLVALLPYYEICPISGQKFDQFMLQIVDKVVESIKKGPQKLLEGVDNSEARSYSANELLPHLHLFVAQGTQYYRFDPAKNDWKQVYSYPLTDEQVAKISETIEKVARELGYWEEDKLQPGDEIIENRLSQVTFSALGQKAGTKEKYAWDPDHQKRDAIAAKCRELTPEFEYEVAGTTSINAITPGMNKIFGMTHLMEELGVKKDEILYFGDMTQPGGNDYPVVQMGIETITVRSHEDTAFALKGILGVSERTLGGKKIDAAEANTQGANETNLEENA